MNTRLVTCLLLVATFSAILGVALWWIGLPANPTAVLQPAGLAVNVLAFGRDGKHLVVGSRTTSERTVGGFYEGELSVWDMAEKKKLFSLLTPQWVQSLSLTEKGDLLAVAIGGIEVGPSLPTDGKPFEIRLYSFPEMKEIGKLEPGRCVNSISFSPDGKLLATVSNRAGERNAEVKVWDVAKLKAKYTVEAILHPRPRALFSANGKTLAVSESPPSEEPGKNPIPKDHHFRASIRQYDADTGNFQKDLLLDRRNTPRDFDYFPGGKRMAIDCLSVSIWDLSSGMEEKVFIEQIVGALRRQIALSLDGKWLVIATDKNRERMPSTPAWLKVLDLENKKTVFEWQSRQPNEISFALSSDRKTIAIGADKVYLFDLGGK